MPSLKVYLASSDKTMHVLPAAAYCWNKFWPGLEIHVLVNSEPPKLPDNFIIHNIGDMLPVSMWSTPIRAHIVKYAPDNFIFTLDDMLPITPANTQLFDSLCDYYITKNLGRIGLTNDIQKRSCTVSTTWKEQGATVIEATQNASYRVSTQPSIWNRDWFLQVMQPNMSPWQFEKPGPTGDGAIVASTRNKYVVHISHGLPSPNIPQYRWDKCVCCNIRPDAETIKVLQGLLP